MSFDNLVERYCALLCLTRRDELREEVCCEFGAVFPIKSVSVCSYTDFDLSDCVTVWTVHGMGYDMNES